MESEHETRGKPEVGSSTRLRFRRFRRGIGDPSFGLRETDSNKSSRLQRQGLARRSKLRPPPSLQCLATTQKAAKEARRFGQKKDHRKPELCRNRSSLLPTLGRHLPHRFHGQTGSGGSPEESLWNGRGERRRPRRAQEDRGGPSFSVSSTVTLPGPGPRQSPRQHSREGVLKTFVPLTAKFEKVSLRNTEKKKVFVAQKQQA